jgi:hypothetical protein
MASTTGLILLQSYFVIMKVTFWHNIIMLEISQNRNIEIEFIFSNWSYELKSTTQKRVKYQIGSLTFNTKT